MKLIRSVIALMLISLSSPYFLHPAARAAAASDDEPTNAPEEGPREREAEAAPSRPPVSGGIAAAVRAMAPRAIIRAPEHGWLSFIVEGEQPIPYTTDSQVLLRLAIERSNLGHVPGHPYLYRLTKEWADNVAKGGSVTPLTLYYVIEGENPLAIRYSDNQEEMRAAIKELRLGLVPGHTQVFYVPRDKKIPACSLYSKKGIYFKSFTYQLSYFYVVVQGEPELDIWCCDKQDVVKLAINDSRLGHVPGAAPNVFYITETWKKTLDEAGTRLLNLRISFPGEDWTEHAWYCADQRLVRQAIRESQLGRVPHGLTNTYYATPAWKDRLLKGEAARDLPYTYCRFEAEERFCSCAYGSGKRPHLLWEAITDSGLKLHSIHFSEAIYSLPPKWSSIMDEFHDADRYNDGICVVQ